LHYLDLARHLGSERPFYGLHAPGLYGEREPLTEVDTLAAEYLSAIRIVQPDGPYALGGWSFGGLMAFEVASRLHAEGEEVALLALLDAAAPGPGEVPPQEEDDAEVIAWYAEDFLHFFGRNLPAHRRPPLSTAAELRLLPPEDRLRYLQGVACAVNGLPRDAGLDRLRRYVEVYQINHRAARRYTPRSSYPGAATVFRAADGIDGPGSDRALGWSAWVRGALQVHVVPGTHDTFIEEPNVPALAAQLRLCLDSSLGRA
jgi:thioesterase domain-containing protein